MTLRSIYTALKIKPTTARNLREYSFLCACGALWNAFDLYHVLQWSHLHGMMDQVDSKSFCAALKISGPYGPPDLVPVPVFVIVVRIVSRFLFWAGSSIILASYSSKMDRYADGFRLVGFLFFATTGLDIMTTFVATGRSHLLFANFGSVRETLTTLVILSVLAFLLFPGRKAKQ
jgi:hypothetical protein